MMRERATVIESAMLLERAIRNEWTIGIKRAT